MEEIIKIISSISVLVASLAGLSAINKWKTERFEKAKIDCIEKYENTIRRIKNEMAAVLDRNVDQEYLDHIEFSEPLKEIELFDFFEKTKRKVLNELNESVSMASELADDYFSFAGHAITFNFNYYKSTCSLMEGGLDMIGLQVVKDASSLDCDPDDFIFDELILRHIKSEASLFVYIIDLILVHNPYDIVLQEEGHDDEIKDFRDKYNQIFYNMIRLEKIYLHSSLLVRCLLKIKIFFIKYRVVGRVVLATKKDAIIIMGDGSVARVLTKGRDVKAIEGEHRVHLMYRMFSSAIMNVVS